MNKLLVSDIIDIEKGEYILNCQKKDLTINIKGEVTIYLVNELLNKLKIILTRDSVLKLYKFNKEINEDLEVDIIQNDCSKIFYNEAFINNSKHKLIINNLIKGNNNESIINIRNISNKDLSKIIINVNIEKDTINNIALEDLKGTINGGFIHIEPNIVASSNDIKAEHFTTIGGLDQSLIDYLMSKGINKENCKKILLKGFIFSNMDNYILKSFGGD